MAARAREEVTRNWDMEVVTQRLVGKYRELIQYKRDSAQSAGPLCAIKEDNNL